MTILDIKNAAHGVGNIIRYEGPHFLPWRVLMKLVRPFGLLRMQTYYQRDLTRPLCEYKAKTDLVVARAEEEDIEQLEFIFLEQYGQKNSPNFSQSTKERICSQERKNDYCFLGKIGKTAVHYNWALILDQGEAYTHDAYTLKEWRGKGIHTAVQNEMLRFLKEAGCQRATADMGTHNISSRKAHDRLGWKETETEIVFIPRWKKKRLRLRIRGAAP